MRPQFQPVASTGMFVTLNHCRSVYTFIATGP